MEFKSHVIRLYPSKTQDLFFRQSCGVARFAHNWSIARRKELHERGLKCSTFSLVKELNSIKKEQFPWMLDVGKCAPQYGIHNAEKAFKNFFNKTNNYPKFKKKGIKDSFVAVENKENFKQENKKIRIPRLGWVKCAEDLRFTGKVNNVTVKRIADMWFASINVEIPSETPIVDENQAVIGVDLGIKHLAVCSDGVVYENPKALKFNLERLIRAQRKLSRKQKGSNNQYKQRMKVARIHYRISCIRSYAIHRATTDIVNRVGVIVLEDLNVKDMVRNPYLAQSVQDTSMSEFRRQIEYKASWQGKRVEIADRWFPSSQIDHKSGNRNSNLKLFTRTILHEDGSKTDRDLNAAINLKNYYTGKAPGINACGDEAVVSSVKQEIDFVNNLKS